MILDCVNNISRKYGVKPYTLEEEINLPEAVKTIRNDKHRIVDYCSWIREELETIEHRAKEAVENDDSSQAYRMDEFADLVYDGLKILEEASTFGVR